MRCRRIRTGLVVSLLAAAAWPTMGTSADSLPLEGTAWVLVSLGGRTPPTEVTATAQFDAGRVSGTNGCNRYSAPVVIKGTKVEIGANAATTNMACAPDIMKLADAFMTALTSARSYRISSHQLQLLGADAKVLATFSAQSQSLAGTSWHVTSINNGKDAVVSLVPGSSVTMDFATGGVGWVQQLHHNLYARRWQVDLRTGGRHAAHVRGIRGHGAGACLLQGAGNGGDRSHGGQSVGAAHGRRGPGAVARAKPCALRVIRGRAPHEGRADRGAVNEITNLKAHRGLGSCASPRLLPRPALGDSQRAMWAGNRYKLHSHAEVCRVVQAAHLTPK